MDYRTYLLAFLMGLTGSLHCAGMCGAIIWVMPFQFYSGARKFAAIALYHAGRITVYAAMAGLLHFFRTIFRPQAQQAVSVALGCILLIAGLASFLPDIKPVNFSVPWAAFVRNRLGRIMGRPGLWAITIAGALNGLLPCGLVYMALSATMTFGSYSNVTGFMYAFGLGTVPMLISITLLKGRLTLRLKHTRKYVPLAIFFFGLLFVLRGLNLGIPYVSPRVQITQHQIHSCCHK